MEATDGGGIAGAHHGEVRFCAKKHADPQGKLVFDFHFGDDGEFEEATLSASEVPQALEDCVRAAVNRWKFPKIQKEGRTLPFEFPLPAPD